VHDKPGGAALVTVTLPPITTGVVKARMLTARLVGAVSVRVCTAELTLMEGLAGSLQLTAREALPSGRFDGNRTASVAIPLLSATAGGEERDETPVGTTVRTHEYPATVALVTVNVAPVNAGVVTVRMVTLLTAGLMRVTLCATELAVLYGLTVSLHTTESEPVPG